MKKTILLILSIMLILVFMAACYNPAEKKDESSVASSEVNSSSVISAVSSDAESSEPQSSVISSIVSSSVVEPDFYEPYIGEWKLVSYENELDTFDAEEDGSSGLLVFYEGRKVDFQISYNGNETYNETGLDVIENEIHQFAFEFPETYGAFTAEIGEIDSEGQITVHCEFYYYDDETTYVNYTFTKAD